MRLVTQLNIPILDRWVKFNDVLLGEAINHPSFEQRQRVKTNKIKTLDEKLGMALCLQNEAWQLGKPGKLADYVDPVTKKFF